jgi:hypothetical protein
MMYNVSKATRETRTALFTQGKSMAYNATNGGNQKAVRESDTVIVPKIPGNAGVGKDVYTSRTCPRDTFTLHRER